MSGRVQTASAILRALIIGALFLALAPHDHGAWRTVDFVGAGVWLGLFVVEAVIALIEA